MTVRPSKTVKKIVKWSKALVKIGAKIAISNCRGVGAGGAGGAAAPPMFLEINTGPPSGPPKIFRVH